MRSVWTILFIALLAGSGALRVEVHRHNNHTSRTPLPQLVERQEWRLTKLVDHSVDITFWYKDKLETEVFSVGKILTVRLGLSEEKQLEIVGSMREHSFQTTEILIRGLWTDSWETRYAGAWHTHFVGIERWNRDNPKLQRNGNKILITDCLVTIELERKN